MIPECVDGFLVGQSVSRSGRSGLATKESSAFAVATDSGNGAKGFSSEHILQPTKRVKVSAKERPGYVTVEEEEPFLFGNQSVVSFSLPASLYARPSVRVPTTHDAVKGGGRLPRESFVWRNRYHRLTTGRLARRRRGPR